jgi:hypothetical protein
VSLPILDLRAKAFARGVADMDQAANPARGLHRNIGEQNELVAFAARDVPRHPLRSARRRWV